MVREWGLAGRWPSPPGPLSRRLPAGGRGGEARSVVSRCVEGVRGVVGRGSDGLVGFAYFLKGERSALKTNGPERWAAPPAASMVTTAVS